MKILVCPDSFKGTMSSSTVCDIIGEAFKKTINDITVIKLPVADGGEGLCACLENAVGGTVISARVSGVFGERMTGTYLMLRDMTAVIEMAVCAGLPLAKGRKNPLEATAYGVGELIADAVSKGAQKILLGLGGSATNECGLSVAAALGWTFLTKSGKSFVPTGGTLSSVSKIIPPKKRLSVPVIAACDVDNPLFGKNGAAYVFSPQKGADKDDVITLDNGLRHIADIIERDLNINVRDLKGAGAAGGLGAGAVAFLGAELQKGIDIILSVTRFDQKAADCDLIITGEGRLDYQSLNGKVISGVAMRSKALGKPVITICGCHGEGAEKAKEIGITDMFACTNTNRPFDEIIRTCKEDLFKTAEKAALKYSF